jgi:ferredoxin/flavodoxin
MSLKKLNLVYFSPTGTTRRTVHNIASGTAIDVREIDRTPLLARRRAHHFAGDEPVVLALPVYGGRLPRISDEFFAGLTSDRSPAAIVVVYGNRHYDDALLELRNRAAEAGFAPIAAGAFLGEHSYSRNVAANRPDDDDASVESDFGARFVQKILARAATATAAAADAQDWIAVPGQFPYAKDVVNQRIAPVANDECVNCQTCVEGCPVNAIDHHDPRNVDKDKCISCCYCVKVCPKGARRMEDPRVLAAINRLETLFMTRREPETFL